MLILEIVLLLDNESLKQIQYLLTEFLSVSQLHLFWSLNFFTTQNHFFGFFLSHKISHRAVDLLDIVPLN